MIISYLSDNFLLYHKNYRPVSPEILAKFISFSILYNRAGKKFLEKKGV